MNDWERVREKFEFASTVRLDFHAELLDDFIRRVLRMDPAWTPVSDESSLDDFPETIDVYAERILTVYGVDIRTLQEARLAALLDVLNAVYREISRLCTWRRACHKK